MVVDPNSEKVSSAHPQDASLIAQRICRSLLGSNTSIDVTPVPNARHLLFRVQAAAHNFAFKLICGQHAAFDAEVLARKLPLGSAVPRIVACGHEREEIDYVLLEWIDGESLAQLLGSPAAASARAIFASAGRLIAEMHSLGAKDAANLAKPQSAALAFGTPDFFAEFKAHLCILSDRFGSDVAALIDAALRPIASSVEAYQPLAICHGDMQPKNVIVAGSGTIRVVDWEFLSLAPRWADFSQLLRHAPNSRAEDAFLSGYSTVHRLPDRWRAFARAYDLVRICLGLSRPALRGSDLENWIGLLRDLASSVQARGAHVTYRSSSFLR